MGLLSSKTIIYVTHQVEFLPTADLILVSVLQASSFLFFFPLAPPGGWGGVGWGGVVGGLGWGGVGLY